MDIKSYWTTVNEVARQLPGEEVYLMSVDNPDRGTHAGAVCEAQRKDAAECIVRRTHRLATKDEIEAHMAKSAANVKRNAETEKRRKPEQQTNVTLALSADQLAALANTVPLPKASAAK